MKAVDPDIAIGHDAIEDDVYVAMRVGFGKREILAVPADPIGKVAAALSGWIGLGDWSRDAPVVGNIEGSPSAVVERGLLGTVSIFLKKSP